MFSIMQTIMTKNKDMITNDLALKHVINPRQKIIVKR